jgi:hypothetical protein
VMCGVVFVPVGVCFPLFALVASVEP